MFWKCKLIFPTDTLLQQKIKITDLKPFLAGENADIICTLYTQYSPQKGQRQTEKCPGRCLTLYEL